MLRKSFPLIAVLFIALFCTCSTQNGNNTTSQAAQLNNEHIYWVNSFQVDCTGVAPMRCLQVQKGESIQPGAWELFYDNIKGFTFAEGHIYKLRVRETQRPAGTVPADASSIEYELVEELQKKEDKRFLLHDSWGLEAIEGSAIDKSVLRKEPQIMFDIYENRISGNDGCNDMSGSIQEMLENRLIFGPLVSTKMACPEMDIPQQIKNALTQVRTYKLDELTLYLYDAKGIEILRYRKLTS